MSRCDQAMNPLIFVQLIYMVQIAIAGLAAVLAWLFHINVTSHFLCSTILNYAKSVIHHEMRTPNIQATDVSRPDDIKKTDITHT